jgi:MFS family permease
MEATSDASAAAPARRSRAEGAARANLAGALGTVWATYSAPGSILLTLFLQEALHAAKWQIGLVMTMTYLGPTFEPAGAFLAERLGRRRSLFIGTFLINRLAFFAIAAIPFLGRPDAIRDLGIALVFAVVGVTRVAGHLGTPAWWSWMADLVPERRRARWLGCRVQWGSTFTAVSFLAGMLLLQTCGGMNNRVLVSALFAVGALFGTLDILLYLRVPELPLKREPTGASLSVTVALARFAAVFRHPAFGRLILGMGLWSFSANLVLPFLPIYQRGESVGDTRLGLGMSWLMLALFNVLGSVAGMLTSRRWGELGSRLGPRPVLLLGAGYLFSNLIYLVVAPAHFAWVLVPLATVSGALNAAWTVGANQALLGVSPRQDRSFFVSAYNFTNGWLMAGGPILGGLLADRLPLLGLTLPGGLPCCYFHVLIALAVTGGAAALVILARLPAPAPCGPTPTGLGFWGRARLLWETGLESKVRALRRRDSRPETTVKAQGASCLNRS